MESRPPAATDPATAPVPAGAGGPVRVLVNALHAKSGGGVTYLRNILPLLAADSGLEVHVCIHADQRRLLPDGLRDVAVHEVAAAPGFWHLHLAEQARVPALARRLGARVTFSPANYGPLLAPGAVILLRTALGVALFERRPRMLGYWTMLYLGTLMCAVACRRVIAVSDFARRTVCRGLLGWMAGRVAVIPHGVSDVFAPPAPGARREGFLLAVSDLYVQKNLGVLIDALGRLGPAFHHVTLKVAGDPVDHDYFAGLRVRIADAGLAGRVEFLGHVSPKVLADLYRRCAVFVFPSRVETFGNPLLEAMACGAPVASSEAAAMPEVAGDAALYFDPADPAALARVLERLLADPDLCRDLGARAVERARSFTWPRTAERTARVLKEAAGR